MWPNDEGDESEGSGERPDPSTRHWRHPSELGQRHAVPTGDHTPITPPHPNAGSTTVWPLVAVGGCLAIAALVVIALQTDLGRNNSLQAGSTATVVPTQPALRTAAASAGAETTASAPTSTIQRTRPPAGEDPSDGDRPGWAAAANPSTSAVTSGDGQSSASRSADGPPDQSANLLESPSLGEVAEVPVYGVYAAPGRDESKLGSFIMIGDDPITSASSLGDRTTVWLRVETHWLEATVVAGDPIADVALLDVDEIDGVAMPALPLADEPVRLGDPAMVGYGDPGAPVDTADTADTVETAGEAPDDGRRLSDDSATGPEDDGFGDGVTDWSAASDRRGLIYSLTKPLTTGSGRLIHHPIRLHTVPGPADAGAPLRNPDGEVIGLVAHSTLPQVAAVPIDRVVDVVGWLNRSGVGNPAWLGLTVSPSPGGLVVTTIDEGGPATALAPGDLIVAVDRQLVFHPDSLEFAARQAGPGQVLDLVIDRQNRRQTIQVEVGTIPPT